MHMQGAAKMGADRARAAGFTLIELLSVICVIAILAGLLLTAAKPMQTMMGRIKCTNFIKEWGNGYLAYLNDNNGQLPTSDAGRSDYWQDRIAPYIVTGTDVNRFTLRNRYGCPKAGKDAGWYYAENFNLDAKMQGAAPRSMAAIRNKAKLVLIVDSPAQGIYSTVSQPNSVPSGTGVDYARHGGQANFVFADFHMETLTEKQAAERVVVQPEM